MTKQKLSVLGVALGAMFSAAAFGQTAGSVVQRDVNQQTRIEQGLQSGELSAREASRLERGEARVERMEANALSDGKLSAAEKRRINRAQNAMSERIYREKHDAQTADPNSASSRRMAADVQRNVNQQARIEQGIQSGALTNHETAKLERGQAHVNRLEARAGADGHVGPREQQRIQHAENRQSHRIFREKHDAQTRD
jgi:hypothetical protein